MNIMIYIISSLWLSAFYPYKRKEEKKRKASCVKGRICQLEKKTGCV